MASFSIDKLSTYESIVDSGISKLNSIMNSYEEGITTSKTSVSSIKFNSWQDDVQVAFQNRINDFDKELASIESSISSEHLPYLQQKLEQLKNKLSEVRKANNMYTTIKAKLAEEEKKSTASFVILTKYENEYKKFKNLRNELVDEINSLINLISSIQFGVSIQSDTTSASNDMSESSNNNTSQQKVTEYYDDVIGMNVVVMMTTTETNDKTTTTRTTTYTNSDGEVELLETITVTTDKNDPRKVKVVDEEGNVYETTVDEKGQLVEITETTDKNGNVETEYNTIDENYYTLQVTNNETGDTSTYTINADSPADMQIFRMICENAEMQEGYKADFVGSRNHALTTGGAESITFQGVYEDSGGTTVSFTPKE